MDKEKVIEYCDQVIDEDDDMENFFLNEDDAQEEFLSEMVIFKISIPKLVSVLGSIMTS